MSDKRATEILQKTFGHLDTVVREKRKKKMKNRDLDPISTRDEAKKKEKTACQSSG